jgi:hypothetical protein
LNDGANILEPRDIDKPLFLPPAEQDASLEEAIEHDYKTKVSESEEVEELEMLDYHGVRP